MYKFIKKSYCYKLFEIITYSLIFFLIEVVTYRFLTIIKIQKYWMIMPILLYIMALFLNNFKKIKSIEKKLLGIVCLISLILMFCYLNIKNIKLEFLEHFEIISSLIIALFLINLIIKGQLKNENNIENQGEIQNKLFNLFYINTSKVHEIVMLIDNKIMKTVEREQISEELLKHTNSLNVGVQDRWSAETGYAKEESTKKRVYENFDVKTTKSIMLRRIYDAAQKNKKKNEELKSGDLTIFENIELYQRNINDTVMILNVLQDSKIKNDSNENLEVNLNKMMDRMLDDFTIDYVFSCDKQSENSNYIIQLPYKSTENFENGYQHNDLQLGKLSLIGIYRGEIDFSKKDSTSSKFLELMSESYHNELHQNTNLSMKSSNTTAKKTDIKFDFSHKKLNKKLHLIDVIAIIQELNIDGKE